MAGANAVLYGTVYANTRNWHSIYKKKFKKTTIKNAVNELMCRDGCTKNLYIRHNCCSSNMDSRLKMNVAMFLL